jgi:hypothetical protein
LYYHELIFRKLNKKCISFKIFSFAKVAQVTPLSSSHAAVLSWSVSPLLARPDVMNQSRVAQLGSDINTAMTRYAIDEKERLG